MLCRITDLMVEVPEQWGMAPRCREYVCNENVSADIIIRADHYRRPTQYTLSDESIAYMESGWQFYRQLLEFGGMMLHASAVEYEGKAYLFSGPSGMGKSTHARLWQRVFGDEAQVFNDDKPALRRLEDGWYAYGTPWCGKDGINQNKKVPLAGICFLERGEKNTIRRLDAREAMVQLLKQTIRKFGVAEKLDQMLKLVDTITQEVPVYELHCTKDPEAALLSYRTMK